MDGRESLLQEIISKKTEWMHLTLKHWSQYELFSWLWWIGVLFAIAPLVIWWKKVDRKRILEIAVYGLVVNVLATFLDVVGSEYVLWEYAIRLLPQSPLLFPTDFILLPVLYMFLYQSFGTWKGFLLSHAVAAAGLAFVIEPVFIWTGGYRLIHWNMIYSFPIYIVIAVISRLITHGLKSAVHAKNQ